MKRMGQNTCQSPPTTHKHHLETCSSSKVTQRRANLDFTCDQMGVGGVTPTCKEAKTHCCISFSDIALLGTEDWENHQNPYHPPPLVPVVSALPSIPQIPIPTVVHWLCLHRASMARRQREFLRGGRGWCTCLDFQIQLLRQGRDVTVSRDERCRVRGIGVGMGYSRTSAKASLLSATPIESTLRVP